MEELILVKLAAMMLVEPWSMDVKLIMDMVLGSGGAVGEKAREVGGGCTSMCNW